MSRSLQVLESLRFSCFRILTQPIRISKGIGTAIMTIITGISSASSPCRRVDESNKREESAHSSLLDLKLFFVGVNRTLCFNSSFSRLTFLNSVRNFATCSRRLCICEAEVRASSLVSVNRSSFTESFRCRSSTIDSSKLKISQIDWLIDLMGIEDAFPYPGDRPDFNPDFLTLKTWTFTCSVFYTNFETSEEPDFFLMYESICIYKWYFLDTYAEVEMLRCCEIDP